MQNSRIHNLVRTFLDDQLNEAEQQEFYALLKDPAQQESLSATFMELTSDPDMQLPFDESLRPVLSAVLQADRASAPVVEMYSPKRWRWLWAAASVLLLFIAGTYFLYTANRKETVHQQPVSAAVNISPGREGAVLTLADGSRLLLDSLADGVIAQQQGAALVMKNKELAYESRKAAAAQTVYNTISTPRGRQYQFQLPDGTGVWLNAGSSIIFPTVFNGKERNVTITGEVYFEVAKKNASNGNRMPFTVAVESPADPSRNMEISVLGTHFNVNAYPDEPQVKTTLLEGSIKLKKNKEQYLLLPGQQARLQNNGTFKIEDNINAEEILAWKNGYFYFDHTDLQTVMRQLSRWYDVSVEYRGDIPDLKFVGEIPRNAHLEEVFQILAKTKLRFTVEDKKIIVHP